MISVVGIDFRSANLEAREKLALSAPQVTRVLHAVAAERIVPEAVILSTCNRTEFYFACDDEPPPDLPHLLAHVAEARGDAAPADPAALFRYDGTEAVRRLFRIAGSLESQIVGEHEIAAQVREAYRLACEARTARFLFHKLMHWAFRAGKRVQSETALGRGTASVPQAAVDLARQVFASLAGKTVLLVGAGPMAELACQALVRAGADRLVVANRTESAARELVERFLRWRREEPMEGAADAAETKDDGTPARCPALAAMLKQCPLRAGPAASEPAPAAAATGAPAGEALSARAIALDDLPTAVAEADLVICSTGAPEPVLRSADLRGVLGAARHSVLMIDISVPRNIDPALEKLSNVYLYNLDSMESLVAENLRRREREIPVAAAIVDDEVRRFQEWMDSLGVVPTIKLLAQRIAEIQEAEIARYAKDFPAAQRGQLQEFARTLCAKILHDPIAFLRGLDGDESHRYDLAVVNVLRQIFHLDAEDPP